ERRLRPRQPARSERDSEHRPAVFGRSSAGRLRHYQADPAAVWFEAHLDRKAGGRRRNLAACIKPREITVATTSKLAPFSSFQPQRLPREALLFLRSQRIRKNGLLFPSPLLDLGLLPLPHCLFFLPAPALLLAVLTETLARETLRHRCQQKP